MFAVARELQPSIVFIGNYNIFIKLIFISIINIVNINFIFIIIILYN